MTNDTLTDGQAMNAQGVNEALEPLGSSLEAIKAIYLGVDDLKVAASILFNAYSLYAFQYSARAVKLAVRGSFKANARKRRKSASIGPRS
mgnify:CR=1 FL=1